MEGTQTLKEEATVVTLHNEVPPERAARLGRNHLGERGWLENANAQLPLRANETGLGGLSMGGFSDAVFNVVASYLGDDAGRFVAEVESIEL